MLSPTRLPRKPLALVLAALVGAACDSPADSFEAGRAQDPCSDSWPVCNTVAGCILSGTNYVGGNFPGTFQYIVETPGPASVAVNVFLSNVTGAGSNTTIDWWETGCTSSFPTTVTGKVFVGETQNLGVFTRSQQLTGVGDHLVTIQSDATASFLLEVDVTPTD